MTPASAARRKISLTKGKLGKEKRQGLTQFLTCGERLDHIRQSVKEKLDRKSTRLNSSHQIISYAVFCLKKKTKVNDVPATDIIYFLHSPYEDPQQISLHLPYCRMHFSQQIYPCPPASFGSLVSVSLEPV